MGKMYRKIQAQATGHRARVPIDLQTSLTCPISFFIGFENKEKMNSRLRREKVASGQTQIPSDSPYCAADATKTIRTTNQLSDGL
jgi:hypothetical protein